MALLIAEQNSLGNGGGIAQDFSNGFGSLPFEPTFSDQGLQGGNLIDFRPSLLPDAQPDTFKSMLNNAFNFVGNLFNTANTINTDKGVPAASVNIPTLTTSSNPQDFQIAIPKTKSVIDFERKAEVEALRLKLVSEGKLKPNEKVPTIFDLFGNAIVEQTPKTFSAVVEGAGNFAQGAGKIVGSTVSEILANNLPFLVLIGIGAGLWLKVKG